MRIAHVTFKVCHRLDLLPLPVGERGGGGGLHASATRAPSPLTRRASRVDLSPVGRGENKFERI